MLRIALIHALAHSVAPDACSQAERRLVDGGAGVIALARLSLARAAPRVAATCGVPVLTTIDSALRRLRSMLGDAARSGP